MNTSSDTHRNTLMSKAGLYRIALVVAIAALAIIPFVSVSSASISLGTSQVGGQGAPGLDSGSNRDATPLTLPSLHQPALSTFLPQLPGSPSIATSDSSCATAQSNFNLGQTVCATATGTGSLSLRRRITWVDPDGFIRKTTSITTNPQNDSFVVPATPTTILSNGVEVSNLGSWRVNIVDRTLVTFATFVVKDPAHATADIGVLKHTSITSEQVAAGSAGVFEISLYNLGPDSAANVTLTDAVPSNATFLSMVQTSGPTFSCLTPGVGSTGSVTCTLASFARNTFASFEFAYTVNAGTASGSLITNTASVSSATNDSNIDNNTASASATVASSGGGSCILDCPNNVTVVADQTVDGVLGAYVNFAAPDASGSCGTVTSSPLSGSFFPVGATPVNSSGSTGGSCSFVVTVLTSAPTISCPASQTIAIDACAFEATGVNPGTPTFTPADGTLSSSRSDDRPLTDPYPLGVTTITWTVTDAGGPSASCTSTITVTSPEHLTISCPANRTVTTAANECSVVITDLATPTSNCNSTVVGVRSDNQALSDPYPAGITTITWTATDPNDHVASCVQTITVNANDTVAPTITAPPAVKVCTTSSTAFVSDEALGAATANDNCSIPIVIRSGVPAGNIFPTGSTTVTYTASDSAGNSSSATQIVTVGADDGQPPTITAPANVTLNTGAGSNSCSVTLSAVEINSVLGDATATDTCSGVEVTRSGVPAGNVFPVGNTTITYTATDATGQTAQAFQTVTVVDNTAPVIASCAPHITANTDANSCSASGVNLSSPIATDNCGSTTATNDAPSSFPLGNTTVHWTVTDSHGNTATCDQVVTVEDHTPPTLSCPADVVAYLPLNSTATSMVVTYPAPTASDSCSTPTVTTGPASGSVFPVGTTTVTVTATDDAGNSSSCTFTVKVLYDFTGFFSPVSNPPTLNAVNAGRAIPVKFSLSGNKGLNIFAVNNPYSVSFNCATNDPGVDVVETVTAGGSSLSYGGGDTYIYVWKTENSWAGTCRQLVMTLNDGSVHTANFKFK